MQTHRAEDRYISYLRLAGKRQEGEKSSVDAQRAAIYGYLKDGYWKVQREFVEIENGRRPPRPRLQEAVELCRSTGSTLLIARLARLSRDAAFLQLLHQAGIRFVAVDLPEANESTVGIMALVAAAEQRAASRRIRTALAAAKERGVRLGNPGNLTRVAAQEGRARGLKVRREKADDFAARHITRIRELLGAGNSLRAIARTLNDEGVLTARGKKGAWTARSVKNIIERQGKQGT